jgi:4-amino-4-deoxy-L-arabinose transferase-like glycosyltransferase
MTSEVHHRVWLARPTSVVPLLLLALALLLAFRIAALGLNATDLFFDEAQYWSWSLEPAFGYYSKPPLIAWLIGLSTAACGVSELCVRLPAPILHAVTAGLVFLIGWRLYDREVGAWSALVYATLPGVSLSAGIISTDVPLLTAWAAALFFLAGLAERANWRDATGLGVALGVGLNAKYAMAYFVLCTAVYLALSPERRGLLRQPHLWAALAIGALLIAPNLAWNAANSFATFSHTADNAKWTGSLVNPLKAAEFLLAQLGVFGPVLFVALILLVLRAGRSTALLTGADRLLICFALPVLVVVTVQAFLSRAHANWAAVSYVAASVLVTATMIRNLDWRWLKGSLTLHLVLVLVLAVGTSLAGRLNLPAVGNPFARTLGWRALGQEAAAVLEAARRDGKPMRAVIADDRAVTAELLYYMRGEPTPVFAWRDKGRPTDHYELTRPFVRGGPEPVLLVALRKEASQVTQRFTSAQQIKSAELPTGGGSVRRVTFHRLEGYQGP